MWTIERATSEDLRDRAKFRKQWINETVLVRVKAKARTDANTNGCFWE